MEPSQENENLEEEVAEEVIEEVVEKVLPEILEIKAITVENSIFNKPIVPTLQLTPRQRADIREAFDLLDHSGSGMIQTSKFKLALRALGYEPSTDELKILIDAIDKEQSGKLSLEEFTTLIMRKIAEPDSDDDIIKSFLLFDIHDAGSVSFENLRSVCKILGEDLSDEEILEMMDAADDDGDGEISREEFLKIIHRAVILKTP